MRCHNMLIRKYQINSQENLIRSPFYSDMCMIIQNICSEKNLN